MRTLKQIRTHSHLHPTAEAIRRSAERAGVIVPLQLEVLGTHNTSPHHVGWSTGTFLDRQHMINTANGSSSYLYVTPPANASAQSALPYTVDLRDGMRSEDIKMHAFMGERAWDDVVTIPSNRHTGDVVKDSFVHKMLKANDEYARTLEDPGEFELAKIDWTKTPTTDDRHGREKVSRVYIINIPISAIRFAKAAYDQDRAIMDKRGIAARTFSIACEPVSDGVWNSLAYTKHNEVSADSNSASVVKKAFVSVGLVFRLRGFW